MSDLLAGFLLGVGCMALARWVDVWRQRRALEAAERRLVEALRARLTQMLPRN